MIKDLRLDFYGETKEQRGLFIIDDKSLTIRLLANNESSHACHLVKEKRDQFTQELSEHVYPYLNLMIVKRDIAEEVDHEYGHYDVSLTFDQPVDYFTILLFLIKVPASILSSYINEYCVYPMLETAKTAFFNDIEDEQITGDEYIDMLKRARNQKKSHSNKVFFFHDDSAANHAHSRNEATEQVKKLMQQDAELRAKFT